MINQMVIRERYLRDELPVRLGGLAANLTRIKSFSDHPGHQDLVGSLLEDQAVLAELQIQLFPVAATVGKDMGGSCSASSYG